MTTTTPVPAHRAPVASAIVEDEPEKKPAKDKRKKDTGERVTFKDAPATHTMKETP